MHPINPLESDDAIERTVAVPFDEISIAQGIPRSTRFVAGYRI